jgi:hypothetical protein
LGSPVWHVADVKESTHSFTWLRETLLDEAERIRL